MLQVGVSELPNVLPTDSRHCKEGQGAKANMQKLLNTFALFTDSNQSDLQIHLLRKM